MRTFRPLRSSVLALVFVSALAVLSWALVGTWQPEDVHAQERVTHCTGEEDGVVFTPDPTCPWEDTGQYSAWVSLVKDNGHPEGAFFPSGTTLCSYGCCLKITCPPPEPAPGGPIHVTIAGKTYTYNPGALCGGIPLTALPVLLTWLMYTRVPHHKKRRHDTD